jgi:glycosyltransferase involved in cell wall biosynthesis
MARSTLVLLTRGFPSRTATEWSFLAHEIPYLCAQFDEVIVVPDTGRAEEIDLSTNARVDGTLVQTYGSERTAEALLEALRSWLFWRQLAAHPNILGFPSALKEWISVPPLIRRIGGWLDAFLRRERIELGATLFYTYWLSYSTLALCLAKARHPDLRVVSRGHGGDLYEDRHEGGAIMGRNEALHGLEHLFAVSEHGRRYVTNRYPWFRRKASVSRLGVPEPGFVSQPSRDGAMRIVSCARAVPGKRLDVLLAGLSRFAATRPENRIEWLHLGGGPSLEAVKQTSRRSPGNLVCTFRGEVASEEVYRTYRERPVDVFASVSAAEGLPVSIMEAQSCGIPVLATAVGGVPEIVNEEDGKLLPASADAAEVAAGLGELYDDPERLDSMRSRSIETWRSLCHAPTNFASHAAELGEICEGTGGEP